jgi:hypothetical protein
VLRAVVAVVGFVVVGLVPLGSSAPAAAQRTSSAVTAITQDPRSPQPFGTYRGVPYERIFGTVTGSIDPNERIAVQPGPPLPATYTAQFELITPADGQPQNDTVLVEVENRGGPAGFWFLNGYTGIPPITVATGSPATIQYPDAGNGFYFNQKVSYARVQWQTGIAAGVPANAQGVGEVIVRDYARLLLGRGPTVDGTPARFRHAIVFGGSQSGWFVNTFLADGFNVDPNDAKRVFAAAFVGNGAGNWLAINQLNEENGDPPQNPYVQPDGVPLTYDKVLTRPETDPILVDAVAYTDYYRLRASISARDPLPANVHRYDLAAAHAPGTLLPGGAPTLRALSCDPIPPTLNDLDPSPYQETILSKLIAIAAGDRSVELPPSRRFRLGGTPPDPPYFNPLPSETVAVPRVDADQQPRGGIPMPDVRFPLGELTPVAIPHVGTLSITDGCGNFGGIAYFSPGELQSRYRDADSYAARYRRAIAPLVKRGYVTRAHVEEMVTNARAAYETASALT